MQFIYSLFKQIIYRIRYKYYQLYNMVKHFLLDKDEEERQRLIDSIEKLKDKALESVWLFEENSSPFRNSVPIWDML